MVELKIEGNELILRHRLSKKETYKISKGRKFYVLSIYKEPTIVSGFTNSTEDGKFIPIFDYDNTYLHIVEEDYAILQARYNLPPAILLCTKKNDKNIGGYHVICPMKFNYSKVVEIIGESRCDPNYKTMNLRNPYKSWVLRISNKGERRRPTFVKMIGANINLDNEVSYAHLQLIKKAYKRVKLPDYRNYDRNKKLKIETYETLNS